jgi:hypothetical protein
MHDDDQDDLFPLATSLPRIATPSRVKQRLIKSAVAIEEDDPESVVYQHTVLCQTCLPYRDPGAAIRRWQRSQGSARLEVEAGRALDPERDEFVDVRPALRPQAPTDSRPPQHRGHSSPVPLDRRR